MVPASILCKFFTKYESIVSSSCFFLFAPSSKAPGGEDCVISSFYAYSPRLAWPYMFTLYRERGLYLQRNRGAEAQILPQTWSDSFVPPTQLLTSLSLCVSPAVLGAHDVPRLTSSAFIRSTSLWAWAAKPLWEDTERR